MSQAYLAFKEQRYFGSLDGLRAISIVGVIWVHAMYGASNTPPDSIPFISSAALGVELFFAISGILITTLLLRERERSGTISLRDFFIRRSLRIWPLYYTVLGIYILLVHFTEHDVERRQQFFHNLPTFATYTYTWFGNSEGAIFNFSWSLSTEEQFYLVWPLLLTILPRAWPMALAVAGILLRALTQFGVMESLAPKHSIAANIMGNLAPTICLGAIFAHLLHQQRSFDVIYRWVGSRLAAPALLIAYLVLVALPESIAQPIGWLVLPLLVLACAVREDNGIAALLRWKPMALIGTVSYGMYLLCNLVVKGMRIGFDRVGIQNPLVCFPFEFAVIFLVAWLSYRYFEKPFLNLKKRFSRVA